MIVKSPYDEEASSVTDYKLKHRHSQDHLDIKNVNFSTSNGKFHLKDTWSSHIAHAQLDYDERKRYAKMIKAEIAGYEI